MCRQQRACENEEVVVQEHEEVGAPGRCGAGLRDRGAMPQPRGHLCFERAAWQHVNMLRALELLATLVHKP